MPTLTGRFHGSPIGQSQSGPPGCVSGAQFSAADVYIGSQIGFGMMKKALEPRPDFQAYVNRLQERPVYKRFVEKGDKIAGEMKEAS